MKLGSNLWPVIARLALLLFLAGLGASAYAQTEDFAIDWHSLDSGGGTSADDFYSVSGTIGQPDAGELNEEVYAILGGFWAAALEVEPPVVPTLSITRVGSNLVISWSAAATGYALEENHDLFQPNGWRPVSQPVVVVNGQNTVTVPVSDQPVYYRLTDKPGLPQLLIVRTGAIVILSWPTSATGYFLEQNFDVTRPDGWSLVGATVVVSNAQNTVTLPLTGGLVFFRLTQTPSRPALTITRSGTNVILVWPASATGYSLEQTRDVTQPSGWSLVGLPVVSVNGQSTVTSPATGPQTFYRLRKPL